MNISRLAIFSFAAFATLSCSICSAQIYDTPETRRQQAEAQRQAEEQKKREANEKQSTKPSLEQKEAEAKEYVGKTFWYLPSPRAGKRLRFYERIPPSSHSQDPNFLFTPLTIMSFVVTGVIMPPPLIYPAGKDEYLLEIKFPDGKVGYVNVVGCCGIIENLYKGKLNDNTEYISTEPAEEILARESALREKTAREEQLAKERAEQDERVAREKAEHEERLAREKAERNERAAREKAKKDRAREQVERKRREAMPSPRIGMTKEQVINRTSWGRPYDINRTITAGRTHEQWVYGNRRYLYFDNGVLTAIQD